MKPQIGVIGGDERGIDFGVEMVRNGHLVLYMDTIQERKKQAEAIFQQITQHKKAWEVTDELSKLQSLPFIFLTVPEYQLLERTKQISPTLSPGTCIIIKQTVPVGTGDRLQEWFDKQGKEIEVIINPPFMEPSSIILGGDELKPGIHKLRRFISNDVVPIILTTRKNAEMIELAASAFRAMKMSFVNEMSRYSELFGTDIGTISKVIGLDPRVGQSFLKAGIGFEDSSLTDALRLLGENGVDAPLLAAVLKINEEQKQWVTKTLFGIIPPPLTGKKIAVWGHTGSIANGITQELSQHQIHLSICEPTADTLQTSHFYSMCQSLEESVSQADALLILEERMEFVEADLAMVKVKMRNPLIIDGRNLFPPSMMKDWGFKYVSVGRKI